MTGWDEIPSQFHSSVHSSLDSIVKLDFYLFKDACIFICNQLPAHLAEWPYLLLLLLFLMCYIGNTRVEWIPNKSKHKKLTLEKMFVTPACDQTLKFPIMSLVLCLPSWACSRNINGPLPFGPVVHLHPHDVVSLLVLSSGAKVHCRSYLVAITFTPSLPVPVLVELELGGTQQVGIPCPICRSPNKSLFQ